ncbi:hypothetical protein KC19_12G022700 [Ceratodon purpureus]|uniref:Uncharacterized protein n=1 Tax=Ceratodon purpureus TaxID=3225 RepID=A0A8T0G8H9_CERPU|nr:hypothetical protein KC19_12G022700 [Ceratodon purpureus]
MPHHSTKPHPPSNSNYTAHNIISTRKPNSIASTKPTSPPTITSIAPHLGHPNAVLQPQRSPSFFPTRSPLLTYHEWRKPIPIAHFWNSHDPLCHLSLPHQSQRQLGLPCPANTPLRTIVMGIPITHFWSSSSLTFQANNASKTYAQSSEDETGRHILH